MPRWTTRVGKKIEDAKTLSGSKAKVLRPCLDEASIAKFEKRLGAKLPGDYREYLLHLGGGGYGPHGGLLPLKRLDETEGRKGIVLSELDHGEPVVLVAEGPGAGKVVVWDENNECYVDLGSFESYYEEWVDDEWLGPALEGALGKALAAKKQKQLAPKLHALVLEYRSLLEGPDAPVATARLALYLGDRATAVRVCEELVAIEHDEEQTEIRGGPYELVQALYAKALEDTRSEDPAVLAPLASHESAEIRRRAAWNPKLPTDALAKMAEDPSDEVRSLVAAHESTSAETRSRIFDFTEKRWKELGGSPKRLFALEAVVRRSRAEAEHVCAAYANGKDPFDPWLVRAALANPELAVPTFASLAKHPHPAVRYGVACQRSLTPALFDTLAHDEDEAVRAALAFHPAAPPATLEALTRDSSKRVLWAAIWNERTPDSAIVRLVKEGRTDLVAALFERKGLPKAAAKLLAKHPEHRDEDDDWKYPPYIAPDGRQCIETRSFRNNPAGGHRRYLASVTSRDVWDEGAYAHPAFPVPILMAYVDEHYGNGGRELSRHPWLDEALLTRMSTPQEPRELHGSTLPVIAAHPRLSVAQLEALAEDRSAVVGVPNNPHTPAALLEQLAESPNWEVRKAVAENLRTPVATLTKLAADPEITVRYSVVGNANTPTALLERLADDPGESVKQLAKWRRAASALEI